MNFSQHWRSENVKEIEYEVTIPVVFLEDYLKKEFDDYIKDAKDFTDTDSELDLALQNLNWPSTDKILNEKHQNIIDLAIKFYSHEVLLEWFEDGGINQKTDYILNSIEKISCANNFYIFKGKGIENSDNLKFQDF